MLSTWHIIPQERPRRSHASDDQQQAGPLPGGGAPAAGKLSQLSHKLSLSCLLLLQHPDCDAELVDRDGQSAIRHARTDSVKLRIHSLRLKARSVDNVMAPPDWSEWLSCQASLNMILMPGGAPGSWRRPVSTSAPATPLLTPPTPGSTTATSTTPFRTSTPTRQGPGPWRRRRRRRRLRRTPGRRPGRRLTPTPAPGSSQSSGTRNSCW